MHNLLHNVYCILHIECWVILRYWVILQYHNVPQKHTYCTMFIAHDHLLHNVYSTWPLIAQCFLHNSYCMSTCYIILTCSFILFAQFSALNTCQLSCQPPQHVASNSPIAEVSNCPTMSNCPTLSHLSPIVANCQTNFIENCSNCPMNRNCPKHTLTHSFNANVHKDTNRFFGTQHVTEWTFPPSHWTKSSHYLQVERQVRSTNTRFYQITSRSE